MTDSNDRGSTLTKTECRQFIDELYMLGEEKEFKSSFRDALKGEITQRKIDNIFDHKRKAYNHAVANIFQKYSIIPDDLYNELDSIWNTVKDAIERSYNKNKRITIDIMSLIIYGLPGLIVGDAAVYQLKARAMWKGYKKGVLNYGTKFAQEHVSN